MRAVFKRDSTARYIYEQSKKDVERMDKEIKDVETQMLDIIKYSESIKENYALAASVKGIGKINAITMLVYTDNFTRFESARQFACYSGVVPFEKTSGSSIRGGSHISKLANVNIKTLLTQAARSAVMYDKELKEYYQRKRKEGKKDKVVINNVRNKLIMRVFSVVNKKQPYQQSYTNDLSTKAA
jgi:transposase